MEQILALVQDWAGSSSSSGPSSGSHLLARAGARAGIASAADTAALISYLLILVSCILPSEILGGSIEGMSFQDK